MTIAIMAKEASLEAAVDHGLGCCPYYLIVDPDDMSFEAVANEGVRGAHRCGRAAKLLAAKSVEYLLTAGCGHIAQEKLASLGIEVIGNRRGSVREVVERFKRKQLTAKGQVSVTPAEPDLVENGDHHGSGQGSDRGRARRKDNRRRCVRRGQDE